MAISSSLRGSIYQKLYTHCPAYRLGGPWQSFPPDDAARSVPADFPLLLRQLAREYSEDQLLDAGLAQREPDGSLAPPAALLASGEPLVFLSAGSPSEMPSAVLTPAGCLSPDQLPITASQDDAVTLNTIHLCRQLLVVLSLPDLIACRALRLPATLAAGLDRLDGDQFEKICTTYDWTPFSMMTAEPTDDPEPQRVVLVDWSLAKLSPAEPPGMGPVIAHLQLMKNLCKIYRMDVRLWSPDKGFIERFSSRLKHGIKIKPKALLDEIQESSLDAMYGPRPSPPPRQLPSSFAAAEKQYRRVLADVSRGRCTTVSLQDARDDYEALLEEMTGRLVQASASPEAQNRQAAQMVISRTLHQLAPSLDNTLALLPPVRSPDMFPHREINAVIKLAATLFKLGKESDACPAKRVSTPPPPRARRRSTGSPTWASRPRISRS